MVGIEPTYDKQTLLTTRFTLCLCLTLIRIMPLVDVVGIEPTFARPLRDFLHLPFHALNLYHASI